MARAVSRRLFLTGTGLAAGAVLNVAMPARSRDASAGDERPWESVINDIAILNSQFRVAAGIPGSRFLFACRPSASAARVFAGARGLVRANPATRRDGARRRAFDAAGRNRRTTFAAPRFSISRRGFRVEHRVFAAFVGAGRNRRRRLSGREVLPIVRPFFPNGINTVLGLRPCKPHWRATA